MSLLTAMFESQFRPQGLLKYSQEKTSWRNSKLTLTVGICPQKQQIPSPTGKPGSSAPSLPIQNHTHPRKPLLDLWLSTPRWRQQQQQQQSLGNPGLWRAAGLATPKEAAVQL